jgi:hypothetical protein
METRTQAVRKLSCAPTQTGGSTQTRRAYRATEVVEAWDKFPEPRGWALRWDGMALAKAASGRSNGSSGAGCD